MVYYLKNPNILTYKKCKKNLLELNSLNDFLFFISILKDCQQINNIKMLYILNKILIKYIIYIKYISFYLTCNTSSVLSFYNLFVFNWSLFNLNITKNNIQYNKYIKQKIILIKKVSRTRKKGKIKRYKVVLIIGAKSGWIGVGSSKDYLVQDAIIKARKKAFNNIYYFPVCFFSSLKHINQLSGIKLYIKNNTNLINIPQSYVIRSFFECVGTFNIIIRKIGTLNIYNTINYMIQFLSK